MSAGLTDGRKAAKHAGPSKASEAGELAIALPREMYVRIAEKAAEIGWTVERLAVAGLEEWLRQRDEREALADEILDRNHELYRRLA